MAIVLISSDLLFRSKIELAARQLGQSVIVRSSWADLAPSASEQRQTVMIDLDELEEPSRAIAQLRQQVPTAVLIGYGSHVDHQRQQQAKAAGCQVVLPRSAFVQQLPALCQLTQQAV